MGVPARVILYAPTSADTVAAAARAYDRIGSIEWALSDYRPDSELSRFPSRSAATADGWVSISEDLWSVFSTSTELHRISDGAFDLTVGPASQLWRRARVENKLPEPNAIAAARELIDFHAVQIRGAFGQRQARIKHPRAAEFRLDAGGIGKGYAAEQAVIELRDLGYPCCLVALAGDIALGDAPPGKSGWEVAIAPDGQPSAASQSVILSNCSVSTSGDAEQHLDVADSHGHTQRFSHIVDPRTGVAVTSSCAVTVVGPSRGGWVDAVAKVGSVAGCEELAKVLGQSAVARCQIPETAGKFQVRMVGNLALWPTTTR